MQRMPFHPLLTLCLIDSTAGMMTLKWRCRWMTSETSRRDVSAGVKWLKDHVALDGQDVVAVTNQSFLRASFRDANIVINGSKTDFVIMSAQVGRYLQWSGICTSLPCLRKALGACSSFMATQLTVCNAGSSKSALAPRPAAK